jgi:CobQ-like glutamine amidotransferase family enzyme
MTKNTQKTTDKPFRIVELYTEFMNIYGDTGNSVVLKKRFELYGYDAEIINYNLGDTFPKDADVVLGGGGQDSSQELIVEDLQAHKNDIHDMVEAGVPMVVICGTYQLFGDYFETHTGDRIKGIGVFDAYTKGEDERLIGNIHGESSLFANQTGGLIGYENHSGQTFLGSSAKPLIENVALGVGNNPKDNHEGCVYKNAIGTYLHGPFLPKNPTVMDFIISAAVENRTGEPVNLDSSKTAAVDALTQLARAEALKATR